MTGVHTETWTQDTEIKNPVKIAGQKRLGAIGMIFDMVIGYVNYMCLTTIIWVDLTLFFPLS
jgi:hypothetical protein